MKNKLVSVIIVNWNGKHHLQKCLSSIFNQKYKEIEVILVDNASDDGSIEFVEKNFPQVKVVRNNENLGFAQANNIGYRISQGEYVLFLNNDTEVTTDFLVHLVNVLSKNDDMGGAQSKILLMDNHNILDSVGSFLTHTGFLYHFGVAQKDSSKYNNQIYIFSAKGACMLFKREILKKTLVDGEIFDSRYFAYFEETDFCHRVWLSGKKIVYVPQSVIYHKVGATSKSLNHSFIHYHSFKNRINSYIKNFGVKNLIMIIPLHVLLCEMLACYFLIRFKIPLFIAINRAIVWNFKNLSQTLKKRKKIQKEVRALSDDEFYSFVFKVVGIDYYLPLIKGFKNYVSSNLN